jgi:hypothetical protein
MVFFLHEEGIFHWNETMDNDSVLHVAGPKMAKDKDKSEI